MEDDVLVDLVVHDAQPSAYAEAAPSVPSQAQKVTDHGPSGSGSMALSN